MTLALIKEANSGASLTTMPRETFRFRACVGWRRAQQLRQTLIFRTGLNVLDETHIVLTMITLMQPASFNDLFSEKQAAPECLQETKFEGLAHHKGLVRAMVGKTPSLPNASWVAYLATV